MKHVELGWIAKAHGLRGEVSIRLHWPQSRVLGDDADRVLVRDAAGDRCLEVQSARTCAGGTLVKFAGIDDRDAADRLRGARVLVDRAALPEPDEGEYYLADLLGARVEDPSGCVGDVVEVRVHATVDTLVIRTPAGELVEQPLVEPWIDVIDVAGRLVRLTTSDGLVR
ncbi:MAG: 16S rRNA processing protein RimM [Polyangiaceae bacterium]|nr:16S rRNA processing protein RimM [Polyangiaceae bacterium]